MVVCWSAFSSSPHRFFGKLVKPPFYFPPIHFSTRDPQIPFSPPKIKKQFAHYYLYFLFPSNQYLAFLLLSRKPEKSIANFSNWLSVYFTFPNFPPTTALVLSLTSNQAPTIYTLPSLAESAVGGSLLFQSTRQQASPKSESSLTDAKVPTPSNLPHGRSTATAFREQGDLSHCRLFCSPALSTAVRIKQRRQVIVA